MGFLECQNSKIGWKLYTWISTARFGKLCFSFKWRRGVDSVALHFDVQIVLILFYFYIIFLCCLRRCLVLHLFQFSVFYHKGAEALFWLLWAEILAHKSVMHISNLAQKIFCVTFAKIGRRIWELYNTWFYIITALKTYYCARAYARLKLRKLFYLADIADITESVHVISANFWRWEAIHLQISALLL